MTEEVLPSYLQFGYDQEEYLALLDEYLFGRRYLLERMGRRKEEKVTKGEEVSEEEAPLERSEAKKKELLLLAVSMGRDCLRGKV
jgi:hypothetical protein